VIGSCADARSLLEIVDHRHPDVVLVDIRMPPTFTDEGLRAAQAIRSRWPGVGVLVLTQYLEVGLATRLFARGVEGCGFLLKDGIGDVPAFVTAVHRVASGGCAVDPIVSAQLSPAWRRGCLQPDRDGRRDAAYSEPEQSRRR
jgi:DNA-binding NarL/FixJ family response regulator